MIVYKLQCGECKWKVRSTDHDAAQNLLSEHIRDKHIKEA